MTHPGEEAAPTPEQILTERARVMMRDTARPMPRSFGSSAFRLAERAALPGRDMRLSCVASTRSGAPLRDLHNSAFYVRLVGVAPVEAICPCITESRGRDADHTYAHVTKRTFELVAGHT